MKELANQYITHTDVHYQHIHTISQVLQQRT